MNCDEDCFVMLSYSNCKEKASVFFVTQKSYMYNIAPNKIGEQAISKLCEKHYNELASWWKPIKIITKTQYLKYIVIQ